MAILLLPGQTRLDLFFKSKTECGVIAPARFNANDFGSIKVIFYMRSDSARFALGKFCYRVLDKSLDRDSVVIADPRWGAAETLFRDENIVSLIQDQVMAQIELGHAPLASWLLARLWYLTNGELRTGLNIYADDRGCQDGGWYYGQLVVESNQQLHNNALAVVYLEGCSYYQDVSIKECSESIDPAEIITALATELRRQPLSLSVCMIEIADPEENMKPYIYGWNGQCFLGERSSD